MSRPAAIALVLLWLAGTAMAADEKAAEALAKQKEVAAANWKKLELPEASVVETESFLVYSTHPGKLTKPLADAIEKHHAVAYKAMQYGEDSKPWPGKLTVYIFAERPIFSSFLRRVEARSPERDEYSSNRPNGDTPHAALVLAPDKSGYLPVTPATIEVAAALLRAKAGATVSIPGWLQDGFGKAVIWRAGAGARASTKSGNPAWAKVVGNRPAKDLWGGKLSAEDESAFAAQFADYWAFGPGTAGFVKLVSSLKPGQRGAPPSLPEALEAAGQPVDMFEKAWKKYNGR
jgi:hypothetical protein